MNIFFIVISALNILLLIYNAKYKSRVPYSFSWEYKDEGFYYYMILSLFIVSNLLSFCGFSVKLAADNFELPILKILNNLVNYINDTYRFVSFFAIGFTLIAALSFCLRFLIYLFDLVVINPIVNFILKKQKRNKL